MTMTTDEEKRVASLRRLRILDTPHEERFDRITKLTQNVFNVPICTLSFTDTHRQWVKSAQGLDMTEIPRNTSICSYVVVSGKPMILRDTRDDARFNNNPMVIDKPYARFYVGYPVKDADGVNIGSLCISDTSPRDFTDRDLSILADLAGWAEAEINVTRLNNTHIEVMLERDEFKKKSMTDQLTQIFNHATVRNILNKKIVQAIDKNKSLAVVMADLDHFKKVNDTYGHLTGDEVLKEAVRRINTVASLKDTVGRYGGDEFLIVIYDCDLQKAVMKAEVIRRAIAEKPFQIGGNEIPVTISLGVTTNAHTERADEDSLIRSADVALYQAKNGGRNRVDSARTL